METPKITLSEALAVGGTVVTVLPHDPVVAIALLPIGAGIWGLRRYSGFRSWVAAQREALEDQEFVGRELACYALERLPVPPVGVKGLLEDGQAKEQQSVPEKPRKATGSRLSEDTGSRLSEATGSRLSEASPSLTSRLPQTMFDLFGDDDPRKRASLLAQREGPKRHSPTTIEGEARPGRARKGGETQPIEHKDGAVTRQIQALPAPEQDEDAWLTQYAETEQPKQKPQQAQKASRKIISIREVCRLLNEEVDDRPHVLIVGNSGAGKTVLAQLLIGTRPGKVVILDPKRPRGWEGPKWGGLPYVSRDKETASYKPMVEALRTVVREMDRRYRVQDEVSEPFEPLTVVLDEAKNSVEECEELAEQYRKIVSIGREVGIRLILLSTTDRAGKLGFSGEADSMDSLAWVRLGNFARDVLGEEEADRLGDRRFHWAAIGLGVWTPFENGRTLTLVEKLSLGRNKAWQKVTYNCQVTPKASQSLVTPPQMEPVLASGAVEEVEEVEERATKPIQSPDSLLEELLGIAPQTVKRFSAEPALEPVGTSAEPRHNGNLSGEGFQALSDAGSEGSHLELVKLKKTLTSTNREEMRNLVEAYKLFTSGVGKERAILLGFKLSSKGRGYSRGKELLDAFTALKEQGLITTQRANGTDEQSSQKKLSRK